ncbi:hypothetical protein RRG08_012478 [Elysia crispata]|uniref:Uncharacterized protein n=1 Tax=Elysia crispata TaxID=231223 RepID=A0AAE1APD5_9GAST|nr:hypothetical protein RRG08_012478 [Elysia crispata]
MTALIFTVYDSELAQNRSPAGVASHPDLAVADGAKRCKQQRISLNAHARYYLPREISCYVLTCGARGIT